VPAPGTAFAFASASVSASVARLTVVSVSIRHAAWRFGSPTGTGGATAETTGQTIMLVAVMETSMAASQAPGDEAGDDLDDPLPDNALFDLYRRFIGEPEKEIDVYLGFGLFFAGIAALAVAFVLFLSVGTYRPGSEGLTPEPAYALAMLAVPTTLLGTVVLLPVEDRALYAALAGTLVTLGGTAGFVWAYPQAWNRRGGVEYTAEIIGVYAVGLTAVVAATGAGLVAHAIARSRPLSFEEAERMRDEEETTTVETWTDEEIQADIDQAMAETEITWGGVETDDTSTLSLDTESAEIDTSGMAVEPETTRVAGGEEVDGAVAGLRRLKGEGPETATSESTVDDEAAALTDLKRRKRQGETPDPPTEKGLLGRVRDVFD